MIIWSGWGILLPIIYLLTLGLTEVVTNSIFNDPEYYAEHGLPKFIGGLIGAGLVWLFVKWLDKKPGRTVIDKQTGQEIVLKRKNHLFFVPAVYWPAIFVVISVVMLFVK